MNDSGDGLPILAMPRDGLPSIVNDRTAFDESLTKLAAGEGPVAVDAERAQGFRYSAKAYLLQFRRMGAGTHLIDPIAFENGAKVADLSALTEVVGDCEWIIHAASQDLPCLIEVGLIPRRIFDTELAGRLLGFPKVGLSTMVEHYFGVRLLKEHSAADWSSRPIPVGWLTYAALDVELLIELRERLRCELHAAGKNEWARQECDYILQRCLSPSDVSVERWRRTSGTHQVHSPRGLAIVRELVAERDLIAREMDKGPGRIVPDKAITELAALVNAQHPQVPSWQEYRRIVGFKRRQARQYESVWLAALEKVANMPASELPSLRVKSSGLPHPRVWEKINPEASARWSRIRPATVELAEELNLPVENLISPDHLRALAWDPPSTLSEDDINAFLATQGARPWQRELLVPLITLLLANEGN